MEVITLNCSVEAEELRWTLFADNGATFTRVHIPEDVDEVGVAVPLGSGPYVVTLTSISTNPTRFTSSLDITLFNFLDQRVISCSGNSVTINFNGEVHFIASLGLICLFLSLG